MFPDLRRRRRPRRSCASNYRVRSQRRYLTLRRGKCWCNHLSRSHTAADARLSGSYSVGLCILRITPEKRIGDFVGTQRTLTPKLTRQSLTRSSDIIIKSKTANGDGSSDSDSGAAGGRGTTGRASAITIQWVTGPEDGYRGDFVWVRRANKA
ncbi:hypothetical protein EVAR_46616_1 [Eumeta japonica]|uniref:Uncharacterized protein n=1 Tax=Eumeta variegata TaxID=151549 RepID=A0A4C1ZA41_EUMVA|nr:hypothetical protein EVAR_46616_1 [Eumeta japonica]